MPNSKRPVVYLSGPISKGNRSHNLFQFMDAHRLLLTRGFAVINPGLTAMLPWDDEVPHEEWLAADLPVVERCDLVIRLPGDSLGGDMEVDHAIIHGIPVLHVESRMDMELQLVAMDSDSCVQETEDREVPVSKKKFTSGMERDEDTSKIDISRVFDGPMLDRWAWHLTAAVPHYNDVAPGVPNWTQANSIEEFVRFRKSAARHFRQWMRGDQDEDHAAAVLFNINGAEYTAERIFEENPDAILPMSAPMVLVEEEDAE